MQAVQPQHPGGRRGLSVCLGRGELFALRGGPALPAIGDLPGQTREKQVNVRVVPTHTAIEESVDLAHEVFNVVFRKVPGRLIES